MDIIIEYTGKDFFKKSWYSIDYTTQLTYAEKIGLGSMNYELVDISSQKVGQTFLSVLSCSVPKPSRKGLFDWVTNRPGR